PRSRRRASSARGRMGIARRSSVWRRGGNEPGRAAAPVARRAAARRERRQRPLSRRLLQLERRAPRRARADPALQRLSLRRRLPGGRFPGRTEREVAWRIDELFHELGAAGPAFETIVAAGAQSAGPHARPTEQVIEPGQTVVIDAAARIGGYCTDCTRTFATG